MNHPLSSFVRKLNRAEKHLDAIKAAIAELGEIDFYEVRTELDYKRRPVGRFRNVQRPELLEITVPLLIGDCVYNLRSALDHLAYALASGHTVPLPEKWATSSAFPIFNKRADYQRSGSRGAAWKMRGMSRFARGAIERIQPYHRRKHPPLQNLWLLEELCNVDKHRFIHVAGAIPAEAKGWVEGLNAPGRFGIQQFFGPIEEGAKFQRILGDLPAPAEVQMKPEITLDIIFDKRTEVSPVRGHSVVGVLGNVRAAIWLYVVEALGKEIERLFDARLSVTLSANEPPAPRSG